VNLTEIRELAHRIADIADGRTMRWFRGGLDVRMKADGSMVTEVDEHVETLLTERILVEFPDHRIVGEEFGSSSDDPDAPVWIIDPIDGTTNFVRGNPIFATLIGFSLDGQDVFGLVSAPALGLRWDGIVGQGARQNGRPIQVSTVDELSDAEVAFGSLRDLEAVRPGLVTDISARTGRQRGYGDFWNYCLLAAGSTDIVLEGELKHWDLSAVRAIVLAAGGRVTDLTGRDRSDGGSAVATNGLLHQTVLALADARHVG